MCTCQKSTFLLFSLLVLAIQVWTSNAYQKEDFEKEIEFVVLSEGDLSEQELQVAAAEANKKEDCDGVSCLSFERRLRSAIAECKRGKFSFTKSWTRGKIISDPETTVAINAGTVICGCACENTPGCIGIHRNTQSCYFHNESAARFDKLELSVYWTKS